ncbi:MAG: hypothetical protein ABJN22_10965 [Litorimonas sp.]
MTEPTQTNPAPTAVPWTPDMMTPTTAPQIADAIPAPVYNAPQAQPQIQPVPYQPAPQAYAQPAPQQQVPHTLMQPVQYIPAPHPSQHLQPQAPSQMPQPPQYAPPQHHPRPQQHYVQPGPPPPLTPQMQPALEDEPSKSFIVNLLKRSPKPQSSEQNVQTPAGSGSLFNKNFAIGAVTGLVVGAFILPMVLNLIGGDAPAQSQVQYTPSSIVEITPTTTDGDTFIDNAISSDAP